MGNLAGSASLKPCKGQHKNCEKCRLWLVDRVKSLEAQIQLNMDYCVQVAELEQKLQEIRESKTK